MNIATDGRNPSLLQYVLRGVAFLLVLLVIFVLLFMRYQGTFSKTVAVTADLLDLLDQDRTIADSHGRSPPRILASWMPDQG